MGDKRALMHEVRLATAAKTRAEDAADRARERLAAAVRKAVEAKVPVPELVGATGLTRGRIYQIRDGRRK